MKKILVLVADYPNNDGGVALMYVHVRNKYYILHGINVTVLNFASKEDYEIDGIKVISLATYKQQNYDYDILVLHAANLRNHYLFLKKYEYRFKHMIFFFHGHEVVMINKIYPKPFAYTKRAGELRLFLQDCYDRFKLALWHRYLPKVAKKSDFIFVSNWFYGEFKRYVGLSNKDLYNHVHIINNSVGEVFEKNAYSFESEKNYDFITIRSNMDGAKYGIDLVDRLAHKYKEFSFLIIGKGDYYKINTIPSNVTWINGVLSHEQIMMYIDQSKCGLLLTREDTQGVMTCELAVYGIPVITSDIEVCREICGDLKNVALIDNDIEKVNLKEVFEQIMKKGPVAKSDKFSYSNTVWREEELIKTQS